jgi:uncharacterized protein
MIIKIKVRPNSDKQETKKINDLEYYVNLKERVEDNKANIELLKLLKRYFNNEFQNIKIIKGKTSRKKIIEIK